MKSLLSLAVAVCLLHGWADTAVSDVVVSQRWPWSEKVDVAFALTGDVKDVDVSATWDGQPSSVLLGTVCEAKPGTNRFTWDPASSPWADKTLTGFCVTLTPVAAPTNRYLVVDLENGGVSYRAVPDGVGGKWSDAYKMSKMVFRRIPAGTYQLGMTSNQVVKAYGNSIDSAYTTAWGTNAVTFTSDFYVGVFKMTEAQYTRLTGEAAVTNRGAKIVSYDALRGSVAEGVNWPSTKYAVSSTSIVQRLRTKVGRDEDSFHVDLCHESQWEAAMRAGTTTMWPNGGEPSDSPSALTNLVETIAWRGSANSRKDVGCKEPNGWGIYDPVGIAPDWSLCYAPSTGKSTLPNSGLPATATDPIGGSSTSAARRVIRSSGDSKLYNLLPGVRQVVPHEEARAAARFCIHLKPLGFKD